jgi:hypothetical protein
MFNGSVSHYQRLKVGDGCKVGRRWKINLPLKNQTSGCPRKPFAEIFETVAEEKRTNTVMAMS